MIAEPVRERRQWLSVIARAPHKRLADLAEPWIDGMSFEWLRRPEVGLYLAQGRMDGRGDRFNLADVTVTRCALRSTQQTVGVGYVMGRQFEHARTMAQLDALLQLPGQVDTILEAVVWPLHEQARVQRQQHGAAAQESKVQFYTLAPDTSAKPMGSQP